MKREVLYISSSCSNEVFKKIEETKKKQSFVYGMPIAGNKFHALVMKGLNLNDCEITALTGIPVSNKTHNKIVWRKYEDEENNIKYKYLGFINLPILKHFLIGIFIFFNILKWNKKNKDNKKIMIFDASYVSVIPFITLANKLIKCDSLALFMDVYDYMAPVTTQNVKGNSLKNIIRNIMRKCYDLVSGYIFLSEPMNKLINKTNKPYIIMEGIVDSEEKKTQKIKKNDKFIIMYAGALREEYGLKILVDGYMKYKNKNSELWIFGDGDYSKKIIKNSEKDERIKFFGTVSNREILKYEKKASLLVNPRPTKSEFTKYSFPSKIMEYMSSGTPVLTTKLPTIPDDYKEYLYYINKESANGICEIIEKISNNDNNELKKMGEKSKKFILENKIEKNQAIKIIDLWEYINGENNK